jgi:hypothetical protein
LISLSVPCGVRGSSPAAPGVAAVAAGAADIAEDGTGEGTDDVAGEAEVVGDGEVERDALGEAEAEGEAEASGRCCARARRASFRLLRTASALMPSSVAISCGA